jgi:hypothetical protein
MRLLVISVFLSSFLCISQRSAGQAANDSAGVPVSQALENALKHSRLGTPGSAPFHLRAVSEPANSFIAPYRAEIEEYWISPEKWKRTIRSVDFEQTVIVNGDLRFEQDSTDYFPKWLNDISNALFEVVPPETFAEVSKIDGRVPPSDQKPGEWTVRYSPSSSNGNLTATWGGSIAFYRRFGLLSHVFGKGFSAVFDQYQPFHGLMVSHLIETFPPIPHGDIKTTISELEDLKEPDQGMFMVAQPTPPEKQLHMVQIPEDEYRKLEIDAHEMKWPPVKVRPTTGTLATYIVTDRTGRVREASFIISNNMTLAEGAVEVVKQMRFKPFLVDGVPLQVETTMTFPFETTLEGDQAGFQAASYYFKRGRDSTYPRTDDSAPFHLRGRFEGAGIFSGFNGTYEETWIAPNRWKRQVTIAEATYVESRIDDDYYKQAVAPGVARVVDRVISLFTGEFPGYAYYSPDTDWHMANVEFENLPLLRVAMGRMGDDGKMDWSRGYYFDEMGKVRARTNGPETISYGQFAEFAGKQVPRRIDSKFNGLTALTAYIESIEPAKPRPDDFFALPGVHPKDWVRPSPW